jgi:hypothetical protein
MKKFLKSLNPLNKLLDDMVAAALKKCNCGESLELIGEPSFYSRLKLLGCPKCHLVYYYSPEELSSKQEKEK